MTAGADSAARRRGDRRWRWVGTAVLVALFAMAVGLASGSARANVSTTTAPSATVKSGAAKPAASKATASGGVGTAPGGGTVPATAGNAAATAAATGASNGAAAGAAAALLANGGSGGGIPSPPDYKAWDQFAKTTEAALAGNRLALTELDSLRRDVVAWRTKFQEAQSANKARIATLQSQIAALGPAPGDGAAEAPEIAARRKALNEQLAQLQAPGLRADEAFSRADGIVSEIGSQIRARQASALMQLWPAPINPANWPAAWNVLAATLGQIGHEVTTAWSSYNRRAELRSNMPVILGLLAFALVLLARGRDWMERLAEFLQRNASTRGRRVWALVASLGQIVLPLAGVLALVQAIAATAMLGPLGQTVLAVLPAMGLTIFAAAWLGGRLFPRPSAGRAGLEIPAERHAEGRVHVTVLGVLFALDILRRAVVHPGAAGSAADAVISFPILALTGLVLFRLAQLLRQRADVDRPEDEEPSYRERLIRLIARAVMAVAIVAPLLGAIGYIAAATAFIYPTVLSLALLGLLVVVQRLIEDLYRWVTLTPDVEDAGLVPVLLGFALGLLSVPLFALVWGAREADLLEIWNRVGQGFSIGSTHISPTNFLTFVVLFVVGYSATRLVQGALKSSVLPKTKLDLGGQNAIVVGLGYLGIVVSAVVAVTAAGIDLSSLAIVAGALSVGIGFGLQNIVSNFVSGIILLIERPVSEGDWIDVGGVTGTVRSISVRSTRIETFDRSDVIVPNSNLITGVVTNMTKYSRIGRLIVPVGVAYGTDTRRVDKILRAIAEAHPMVVMKPPPSVVFSGFGADSLDFEVRVILRDVNFILDVKSEINHQIAEKFAAEGIEIPFAQRDIWLRNPEVLHAPTQAAAAPPPSSGSTSEPPTNDVAPMEPGATPPSGAPSKTDETGAETGAKPGATIAPETGGASSAAPRAAKRGGKGANDKDKA